MSRRMSELDYEVRIGLLECLVRDLHDLCRWTRDGISESSYKILMDSAERRMREYEIVERRYE